MSLHLEIQHPLGSTCNLNVTIQSRSSILGLTGPSGSGKTSILHVVAGIIHAQHEDIRVQNRSLNGLKPAERSVGLAMQSPHLFPHMNVRRNLLFGAPGDTKAVDIQGVSEWLEISNLLDRSPRNLSGGERQRVALGRAILSKPKLLLLDEPFAALDRDQTHRIAKQLRHHVLDQGMAMIMVSHDSTTLGTTANHIETIIAGSNIETHSAPKD